MLIYELAYEIHPPFNVIFIQETKRLVFHLQ